MTYGRGLVGALVLLALGLCANPALADKPGASSGSGGSPVQVIPLHELKRSRVGQTHSIKAERAVIRHKSRAHRAVLAKGVNLALVPELDPGSATSAVALLLGAMLILRQGRRELDA